MVLSSKKIQLMRSLRQKIVSGVDVQRAKVQLARIEGEITGVE